MSITLTAVSTLLAVVATPVLTWFYVGERIEVPVFALLQSTAKIVLVPVVLGITVNRLLAGRLADGEWLRRPLYDVVSSPIEPRLILAKPRTFMNRSGSAVSAVMADRGLVPEDVLVVVDDVDLYKFPVPHFFPLDGGRYIGTSHFIITLLRPVSGICAVPSTSHGPARCVSSGLTLSSPSALIRYPRRS